MSDTSSHDIEGTGRQCEYCKNTIHADAKVCEHCGRSQNILVEKIKLASVVVTIVMVLIALGQVGISSWQMWETRQKRIEAQGVLKEARKALADSKNVLSQSKIISQEMAEDVEATVKSINSSLSKTKETTENKLKELTDNISFIESETEDLVNATVTKVDNQIRVSEEKLSNTEQLFTKRTSAITHNLETLKSEVSQELEKLKWRDKLMILVDQSISEGSTESFRSLEKLANKEKDILKRDTILSYILQVKGFYISGNRFKKAKAYKNGKEVDLESFETKKLISYLKLSNNDSIRFQIAEVLGKRKEKGVPEALYFSVNNDKRLDLAVRSLTSFSAVTGYISNDIFGGEDLKKYWEENREKINKSLKEPYDSDMFKKLINYDQLDLSNDQYEHNYFDINNDNIFKNFKWIPKSLGN